MGTMNVNLKQKKNKQEKQTKPQQEWRSPSLTCWNDWESKSVIAFGFWTVPAPPHKGLFFHSLWLTKVLEPLILYVESKRYIVLFHLDPEQDTTVVMQSESFAWMLHSRIQLSYLPGSAEAQYLGVLHNRCCFCSAPLWFWLDVSLRTWEIQRTINTAQTFSSNRCNFKESAFSDKSKMLSRNPWIDLNFTKVLVTVYIFFTAEL